MVVVKSEVIDSQYLKNNPLNDPSSRKVYTLEVNPFSSPTLIVYLSGFLSSSISLLNYDPLVENFDQKLTRLSKEGKIDNMVVLLPDTFTYVGGNQYINSPAVGLYEDFIVRELIPYFKDKYHAQNVVLMGKSSGGYGAMVLGMKYPRIVSGVVNHSGDAYFEYIYIPMFPRVLKHLRKFSSPKEWLKHFWERSDRKRKDLLDTLILVAMSAFYSPQDTDILLPFELETGEINYSIWNMWLEKDPVRIVDKMYDNLRNLKLLYIDVGNKDEFKLDIGLRILHEKLNKHGVNHFYEEYDGGHFNMSFRYDISLSLVSRVFNNK
ncbi:esterase [Sulfolobus acidocaldarius SUSAZ]|nr:esterase [Sulfolobus acidocaldarius SUSAZ]